MHPSTLPFAGESFLPLPERALYWPRRSALLVADVHFEKGSFYAARGYPLPPYDTIEGLDRLEGLVERLQVREVWSLGDSFHDVNGGERMDGRAAERLRLLTARTAWTWITGNHDPAVAGHVGGRVVKEALVDGIHLRHEALAQPGGPELSGHYHPKLMLTIRGRRVARPCFVIGEDRMILPAFSAFAGGLSVDAPELRRLLGPAGEAIVATGERVMRFPLVSAA